MLQKQLVLALIISLLFLVLFWFVLTRTHLIRQRPSVLYPKGKPPFSLSLFILALWVLVSLIDYSLSLGREIEIEGGVVIPSLNMMIAAIASLITAAVDRFFEVLHLRRTKGDSLGKSAYSRNLLRDIFSDGEGWKFYRLQYLVITLILMSVHLFNVNNYQILVHFDTVYIVVYVLSAMTYLGIKIRK